MLAALERLGEPGEGPGRVLLSTVRPIAEELAAALREHPAANRVEVAGSVAALGRDLQGHRPDRHRRGADRAGRAPRRPPADRRRRQTGPERRPRPDPQRDLGRPADRRRRRPSATCSSTSPAPRPTTCSCAKRRSRAASRSPSTGSPRPRAARSTLCATRGGGLRAARLRLHRARAARGAGRAEGGARRQAAGAGRGRGHPRRPALPHDPLRRAQHAGGDGRGGPRARLRLHGDHRPLGQPRLRRPRHRRAALGADRGGRAPGTRASAASACSPARRSTSASTARSTTPTTWSRRSTGSSPASTPPSRSPKKEMTARVLAAIENPHVDCIGHLTGRLIGRREPYGIDVEAVAEAAARTGTMLEINGNPNRRDLSEHHARLASEAGRDDRPQHRRPRRRHPRQHGLRRGHRPPRLADRRGHRQHPRLGASSKS